MPPTKPVHPIRRVREALKATPPEMGLREYATSAGFAKLLGRSSSLIRNVECGITTKWDNLANVIQRKTGVSSKWLLGHPSAEEPILDTRGRHWSPSRQLDPLRQRSGMPDWRQLISTCPGTLPDVMAHIVRAQLTLELSLGRSEFLESLIAVLERSSCFVNPALEVSKYKIEELIEEGTRRRVWRTNQLSDELDHMMDELQNNDAVSMDLDKMNEFLQAAGDFGWATRLSNAASYSIIGQANEFYRRKFREPKTAIDSDGGEMA